MERALKIHEHKNNLIDYFQCVKRVLYIHNTEEKLKKLLNSPDVDLICAYEHYRLKNYATGENGLNYQNYFPEHFRGIKPPKEEH